MRGSWSWTRRPYTATCLSNAGATALPARQRLGLASPFVCHLINHLFILQYAGPIVRRFLPLKCNCATSGLFCMYQSQSVNCASHPNDGDKLPQGRAASYCTSKLKESRPGALSDSSLYSLSLSARILKVWRMALQTFWSGFRLTRLGAACFTVLCFRRPPAGFMFEAIDFVYQA